MEGKISLSFNTSGYGGRVIKKNTLITTNDPNKTKLTLTITGLVEKIVNIEPSSVYLKGNPGNTLETIVKITPVEKYKFSILSLEQNVNKNIKASLITHKGKEKFRKVKIKASSDKTEQLYDVVTLKTDSKYKPSIEIRVYAKFFKTTKTD